MALPTLKLRQARRKISTFYLCLRPVFGRRQKQAADTLRRTKKPLIQKIRRFAIGLIWTLPLQNELSKQSYQIQSMAARSLTLNAGKNGSTDPRRVAPSLYSLYMYPRCTCMYVWFIHVFGYILKEDPRSQIPDPRSKIRNKKKEQFI